MVFDWLRKRREAADRVRKDADRLVSVFGQPAYFEARQRSLLKTLDGEQSTQHWTKVKLEIARQQSIAIGLKGSDRWP